jgi:hypothetical protein
MIDESPHGKYILLCREHPLDLMAFVNERCKTLGYELITCFSAQVYQLDPQGRQAVVGTNFMAVIGRKDAETK